MTLLTEHCCQGKRGEFNLCLSPPLILGVGLNRQTPGSIYMRKKKDGNSVAEREPIWVYSVKKKETVVVGFYHDLVPIKNSKPSRKF